MRCDSRTSAATRLSFNIGVVAFCRSTAARRFNAGDWRGGCDAFLAWNKARVGGRLVVVDGRVAGLYDVFTADRVLTDLRRRRTGACRIGAIVRGTRGLT